MHTYLDTDRYICPGIPLRLYTPVDLWKRERRLDAHSLGLDRTDCSGHMNLLSFPSSFSSLLSFHGAFFSMSSPPRSHSPLAEECLERKARGKKRGRKATYTPTLTYIHTYSGIRRYIPTCMHDIHTYIDWLTHIGRYTRERTERRCLHRPHPSKRVSGLRLFLSSLLAPSPESPLFFPFFSLSPSRARSRKNFARDAAAELTDWLTD